MILPHDFTPGVVLSGQWCRECGYPESDSIHDLSQRPQQIFGLTITAEAEVIPGTPEGTSQ